MKIIPYPLLFVPYVSPKRVVKKEKYNNIQ